MRFRTGLRAASITVLALASCTPQQEMDMPRLEETVGTTCPPETVEGLDVYDGQGAIDWNAVHASGRQFAIIKATQGTGNVQSRFAANWAGAKAAGMLRGAYHFFDPRVDGAQQAQHFLSVVGPMGPGDLPPMLDLECPDGDPKCLGFTGGSGAAPPADIRARVFAFLQTVEAATGKRPMIYTFRYYFGGSGVDPSGMEAYPLVLAFLNPSCYTPLAPWSQPTFWQYSTTTTVPGVPTVGHVDVDRFIGSLDQLKALAGAPTSGRLDVFARGGGAAIYHKWFDGGWSGWESMGGAASSAPATASWGEGHLDLFARGTDDALWHRGFDGGWHDWESLGGGLASAPAVASWGFGRLDVFVLGGGNALYHKVFDLGSGGWSDWEYMGGSFASAPSVTSWGPGRLDIVVEGTDHAVWHTWFDYGAGGWGGWESLGGWIDAEPGIASWGPGRLDIFVRGGGAELYHRYFDYSLGGWGAGWEPLGGGLASGPTVTSWGPNRLDIFVEGTDNQLWHMYWGPGWSSWEPLGGWIDTAPGAASWSHPE